MEQKKLLLISVSVGVFLIIAFGSAILLISPDINNTSGIAAVPSRSEKPADTKTAVPPAKSSTGIEIGTPNVQAPPTASAKNENNIYINGELTKGISSEKLPNGDMKTIIEVARPANAPPPPTNIAKPPTKEAVPPAAKSSSAPAKPAAVKKSTGALPSDYWVQAGSFSSRARADEAKEYLSKKGIGSIITNTDVNGKTYYRVRVGPYNSNNEAEYWKGVVKNINGMESAQVWKAKRG